jgi:hypothetical protein
MYWTLREESAHGNQNVQPSVKIVGAMTLGDLVKL